MLLSVRAVYVHVHPTSFIFTIGYIYLLIVGTHSGLGRRERERKCPKLLFGARKNFRNNKLFRVQRASWKHIFWTKFRRLRTKRCTRRTVHPNTILRCLFRLIISRIFDDRRNWRRIQEKSKLSNSSNWVPTHTKCRRTNESGDMHLLHFVVLH